jgi:linoleoyl-CoA desaturase
MIFFPKLVLGISWGQAIGGFVLMVFTASIFALSVLLPPHANTESEFPLPDEKNTLPENWFMHMLLTTNDVQEDNWFTRFFMGCFNYHVVHHLFPNVNHVYYPEITKKLEQYAATYGLPYRRMPLLTALKNHFILIKRNGTTDFNIWEETM